MSRPPANPAVRWTIGDVSANGFEALRLSVHGARRVFGPRATYAICVNNVPVDEARARTGPLPESIEWRPVAGEDIPGFLQPHLEQGMAEGVAWKLSPLRLFPERYELSLDNDCILWDMPDAIRGWLAGHGCVLAEDVTRCLGQFDPVCGPEPRNSGIRGLPPGLDYGSRLEAMLEEHPVTLRSELDEQGLQTAALERLPGLRVVSVDQVAISSPFPPHLPHLGRCGAHFVGLNAKSMSWSTAGRPAVDHLADHWRRHRPAIYRRVGLAPPEVLST